MSIRLVIPVKHDAEALSPSGESWTEVAEGLGIEGLIIENLGSEWCVEHGIQTLGICSEESGVESEEARAAREKKEADASVALNSEDTMQRAVAALIRKGLITADDIAAETKSDAAAVVADVVDLDGAAVVADQIRVK